MNDILRYILIIIVCCALATLVFGQELDDEALLRAFDAEMAESVNTSRPSGQAAAPMRTGEGANPKTFSVNELRRTGAQGLQGAAVQGQALQNADAPNAARAPEIEWTTPEISQGSNNSPTSQSAAELADFFAQANANAAEPGLLPQVQAEPLTEAALPQQPLQAASAGAPLNNLAGRGVLEVRNGGFTPDVWEGISRERAEKLLLQIQQNPPQSTALAGVLLRLLLTQAVPPEGEGQYNWLALRAETLFKMGYGEAGRRLLGNLEEITLTQMPQLAQVWVRGTLMSGTDEATCNFVRQYVRGDQSLFWRRALLVCQALEGNMQQLRLSMDLAPQSEKDADPLLFSLLQRTLDGSTQAVPLGDMQPDALHYVVMANFNPLLDETTMRTMPDLLLRRLAENAGLDMALRVFAAEVLVERFNTTQDAERLLGLYNGVGFDSATLQNAADKAATSPRGSMARALLWQAAQREPMASAKARHLNALWERARQDGFWHLARVVHPTALELVPQNSLAWFAPQVVRSGLMANNQPLVSDWWALIENNEQLAADVARRSPELVAATVLQTPEQAARSIARWLQNPQTEKAIVQNTASSVRLFTVLESLGVVVAPAVWQQLHSAAQNTTQPRTALDTLWLRVLGQALDLGRGGEALLLVAEPLLHHPPHALDAQTGGNVVSALRYINLPLDAQALALEVLLTGSQQ